jgi:hypothetical protein
MTVPNQREECEFISTSPITVEFSAIKQSSLIFGFLSLKDSMVMLGFYGRILKMFKRHDNFNHRVHFEDRGYLILKPNKPKGNAEGVYIFFEISEMCAF